VEHFRLQDRFGPHQDFRLQDDFGLLNRLLDIRLPHDRLRHDRRLHNERLEDVLLRGGHRLWRGWRWRLGIQLESRR
jgi:hypothetical protein